MQTWLVIVTTGEWNTEGGRTQLLRLKVPAENAAQARMRASEMHPGAHIDYVGLSPDGENDADRAQEITLPAVHVDGELVGIDAGYPEDEPADNVPTVCIDATAVTYAVVDGSPYDQTERRDLLNTLSEPWDIQRASISFEDKENGYQTEAQEAAPLGWCNSAAIQLERDADSVTVSISCGDPRGAFTMTVRRLTNGTLVMHVPTPEDGMLHRPLRQVRPGTYEIE